MSVLVCSLLFLTVILVSLFLSGSLASRSSVWIVALLACGLALSGCSSVSSTAPAKNTTVALASGNWQISSSASQASQLPSLSGSLATSGNTVTGILHSNSSSCIASTQAIPVTGSVNSQNTVRLTGSNLNGGTLTVTGTLASDGKSLTNAAYTVSGGSCAFISPASANAQDFSSITGDYAGSFSDPDGRVISLTATLTQTPDSDPNGNFQLSGTGTFPSNPCFSSPVSISNSQVTGGNFTLTYADPNTGNSVTLNGSFSQDGSTLTVTNWSLTGFCGPDSGTGLLTRQ
jgi:hypothetical protein